MHIGYDIDGVLSKKDPTHVSRLGVRFLLGIFNFFLPQVIRHWTLNRSLQIDIEIAREIAKNHKISIITARPKEFYKYTEIWLREIANIDYDNLYCVGLKSNFEQRKLDIAKEINIDLFLDDTESTIILFKNNNINAYLFKSWQDIKNNLDL